MICAGDYVKDRVTGRVGEVLEVHGKKCLVEFHLHGKDEVAEEKVAVSQLERLEMPELDAAAVRAVVRGETDVLSLTQGVDCLLDVKPDAEYLVNAADLLAGIRKVKVDGLAAANWLSQVLYWGEDELEARIFPEDSVERLLCEDSVVLCARNLLQWAEDDWNDEELDAFGLKLQDAEAVLAAWLEVGADLDRIGKYPDSMLDWLTADDDDDSIDSRCKERQELFKVCLDELCRRGDIGAITKRGYCCYCGTKVYPQDWETARDAFISVYGKTGEAWPANTLGYIYYYGRCNGGVPEYDEAFRWFSIGHAGGIEESTYKLGDLFTNGFGVTKNGGVAYNLYREVYEDALGLFLGGAAWCKFADAAIRMGNCYRDGIGCARNPEEAYGYYLQARMALQMRMASENYYGDDSVKARLDESLKKTREVYTEHAKVMRRENPFFLYWILDRNHRACRMSWKALKGGEIALTFTRAQDTENEMDWIMATFPAGDYCGLLRKVKVKTGKDAVLKVKGDAKEILFDDFNFFWYSNQVELYRTGEKVAEIVTDSFSFKPPVQKEGKEGKEGKPDKGTWVKGDLEIVTKVWKGQTMKYFPWEKQPVQAAPKQERLLKEYVSIQQFQEDYPEKEEREAFVRTLRNDEIDELVDLCDIVQGKIWYDSLKKQEKVFAFSKHPALFCVGEGLSSVTVYDGPGEEKYVEYGEGLPEIGGMEKVKIGRKEIQAIREVMEDNLLFETENLEGPYQEFILDGTSYEFFFAAKGCENEMSGSNIEDCREDFEHCIHSAHAIRVLEEIRDILVSAGVPKKYFKL